MRWILGVLLGFAGMGVHAIGFCGEATQGIPIRGVPWEGVPPSLLTTISSCCRIPENQIRASSPRDPRFDPILRYSCPEGPSAVGCFQTELDSLSAELPGRYESFLREIPPRLRTLLLSERSCGRARNEGTVAACMQQKLKAPDSSIQSIVRETGANLPEMQRLAGRWYAGVTAFDVLSWGCNRLRGYINPAEGGGVSLSGSDPRCLPRVQLADRDSVKFAPSPGRGVLQLNSEVRDRIGEPADEEREPRSPAEPVVDLSPLGSGYAKRECPPYLGDMGCVPASGAWAPGRGALGTPTNGALGTPTNGAEGTPTNGAEGTPINLEKAFPGLRDVLFARLAEHSIEMLAESQMSAIVALNPTRGNRLADQKKEEFLAAASCLSPDARARVEGAFSRTMDRGFAERVRLHRERLGADLRETAREVEKSAVWAEELRPLFANEGRCGFFADRLGDPASRSECSNLHAEWRMASRLRDEGYANYPILAEELEGQSVLTRIAHSRNAQEAISIHDQVIVRVFDATVSRVRSVCADPVSGGKAATLNPIIARSWVEQNPDSAWVFCAAHVEVDQNRELHDFSRMTFAGISMLVTGGWSGVFLAGGTLGFSIHDVIQRHERYSRDHHEYLAGVGNVGAYLAAKEGLSDFYRNAAVSVGLDSLGLTAELGLLRAWSRAQRLSAAGELAPVDSSTRSALVRWYRGRLDRTVGRAARGLSEKEIITVARLEDEGADLQTFAGQSALRPIVATATRRHELEAAAASGRSIPFSERFGNHVLKGDLTDTPTGGKVLSGGMHTPQALQEVLVRTGGRIEASLPSQLGVELPADLATFRMSLPVRTQEMANGVTRVFVPRSLMNKEAWGKAASSVANSEGALDDIIRTAGLDPQAQGVRSAFLRSSTSGAEAVNQGVVPYVPKSLFPSTWNPERIQDAAREIVATRPVEELGGAANAYEGIYDGVRIRVLVNKTTHEIETAYPTWTQP